MSGKLFTSKKMTIRTGEKERFLKDDLSDISEEIFSEEECSEQISALRQFKQTQRRYWTVWLQFVLFLGNIMFFLSSWSYLETKYKHGPNLVFSE